MAKGDADAGIELDEIDEFLAFLPQVRPAFATTPPPSSRDMPSIVVDGLRARGATKTSGYNSRSDWHSQAACLGLLIDLVRECPHLLNDLRRHHVCFGINSPIEGRALDLVIGTPGYGLWPTGRHQKSIAEWAQQLGLKYTLEPEIGRLREFIIKQPLLAVEAKASVYSQEKAFCRLGRELDSFAYRTPSGTITAGLLMINAPKGEPKDSWNLLTKLVDDYPLRENPRDGRQGFDAFGTFFIEKVGATIQLGTAPSQSWDPFGYPAFVQDLSNLYAARESPGKQLDDTRWKVGP